MLRQRFSFGNLERKRKRNNFVDQSSEKKSQTRMHSSRMRTARLLPVSPSIHCSGGCTWSQGVYLSRGVYLVRGGVPGPGGCICLGVVPGPRGCTCLGGVPGPRGVPAWGVYLVLGGTWSQGVYLPRGVYLVWGRCTWSRGEGEYLPRYSPPVDRILDTRF